jgi:hypothetical protein
VKSVFRDVNNDTRANSEDWRGGGPRSGVMVMSVNEGVDTRRYTGGLSESYEKLVWCGIGGFQGYNLATLSVLRRVRKLAKSQCGLLYILRFVDRASCYDSW